MKNFVLKVLLSSAAIAGVVFLGIGCAHSQTDNTIYVRNFAGANVGAKVAAAQLTCGPNTTVPCILVIDPSLAAWPAGTMPTLCSHCHVWDFRSGPPGNAAWGSISGTLANQTDLESALAGKAASNASLSINSTACTLGGSCTIPITGLVPSGAYNSGTTYAASDLVTYDGASYVCVSSCSGVTPTTTPNWQPLLITDQVLQGNLPPTFNNASPGVSGNSNLRSVFDPNYAFNIGQATNLDDWIPDTQEYLYDQWTGIAPNPPTMCIGSGACLDQTSYPGNGNLDISYDSTSVGFAQGGLLTSVTVYPSNYVSSGASIQAWVIRPSGFPTSCCNPETITFTVIAQIGELDDVNAGTFWKFDGLSIPVDAGDLIAFRTNNRGLMMGVGSSLFSNYREIWLNSSNISSLSDTSINGLTTGQHVSLTATVNGRAPFWQATILPGPSYVAANQPSTVLRLDSNGNIPDRIGRSYDMPWRAKKVIWVGTSIPALSDSNGPAYPTLVGSALQANLDNASEGSSRMTWDGTYCIALMATIAQLTAAPGCGSADASQYSYQNLVLGQGENFLVIDHAHNDVGEPVGTIGDIAAVSAYSASGSTLTLTAANDFTAGETPVIIAPPGDPLYALNNTAFAVLSSGLSSTQFEISTSAISGSGSSTASAANNATFYGAYQMLIAAALAENQQVRIALVTPPLVVDGCNQSTGVCSGNDTSAQRAAIQAIASKWQLPVIDLPTLDGFSYKNYCSSGCSSFTLDGTHPQWAARQILGRILYQALKGL